MSMENEQEQQELWWAPLYVKDADIAYSIKTAVLNYVDKREDQSSPTPYLKQLRTLILAQEWIRGVSLKTSPETELSKIQKVIDQHKTYQAVLAALTEWESDFLRERQQKGLPEFTPAYWIEQRENYDMVKWLGPQVIHSSIYDFGASLSFYEYLSNRQAIIWLQNFIPAKANIPIAIPAPEKPETESQTTTSHTGNTSTQHQEQPTHTPSSQAEMNQYKPTEQELITELCNARACNWEQTATLRQSHNNTPLRKKDHGKYFSFLTEMRNFPDIPVTYMLTPAEWREKQYAFIITQIRTSPEQYQNFLKHTVERYRIAARKRLIDIAEWKLLHCAQNDEEHQILQKQKERFRDAATLENTDIPDSITQYSPQGKNSKQVDAYLDQPAYNFLGKQISEAQLVKKVIITQELQKLLDTETQQQPQPTLKPKQTKTQEPIGQQTADICKTYNLDTFNVVMNLHHAADAYTESQYKYIETVRERITIADHIKQSGEDPLTYGYDKKKDKKFIESAERQIEVTDAIRSISLSAPPSVIIPTITESSELFCNCIQGLELLEQKFKTEHPDFWEKKEHDGDYIDNIIKSYTRSRSRAVEHATALKWLELQSAKQWLLTGFDEMLKTEKPVQSASPYQTLETPSIIIEQHKTTMTTRADNSTKKEDKPNISLDISQAKAEVIAAIKRKGLNGNWPKEFLWSEIKNMMAELDCTKELAIENFIQLYSVHLTAVMPGRTKEKFQANITKALSGKI